MSCSCPHEHPTHNISDQGLVAICNKQYDILSNQLVSPLSNVFKLRRADTEFLYLNAFRKKKNRSTFFIIEAQAS